MPTLILHGDDDQIVPIADSERLHADIRLCRAFCLVDAAEKRSLEEALALADEIEDGNTDFWIERALDEVRSHQFKLIADRG